MNRVKTRISWIIALAIALCVALGVAFGLPLTYRAGAETTYAPTDVFDAGTGSTVTAYKAGAESDAYLGFLMSKNDAEVYFRRNLAFAWYEAAKQDTDGNEAEDGTATQALETERANPGKAVYFSMTFSFPAIEFETFTATFESSEENVSKDGKAINTLVFTNKTVEGEKKFTVKVNDGKEYDLTAGKGDYKFSFLGAGENAGDFALSLTYDGTEIFDGAEAFVNLGDNYAEYRSTSNSKPNLPLAFKVTLPQGSEKSQKVLMKELNGQTFEVKGGTDGTADESDGAIPVTGGSISDNAPAVLVLSETVYAFALGKKFSLDYESIDVLDKSISVNRRYYVAKVAEDGESYIHADESKTADYKTLSSSVFFMPIDDKADEIYLSIRFDLDDGVNTNNKIYLSWYAADTAVRTLPGAEEKKWDYIVANLERENPYYSVIEKDDDAKENVKSADYDEIVENYQGLVDEAAANTSAGTGSYIYLPSLRDLVGSDYADYRNLKFSIFYYTQNNTESSTHSSQTSLSYNALKLEVASMGYYKFRVLAVDSEANAIQLYRDGALVDVTSVNVWDFDEIPEFTFYVKYDGITIEDMEEQTLGSRDTVYNVSSFDIIGLTGYSTDYKLYFIDESNAEFAASGATIPSYSNLVKNVKDFMEGDDYADARKSLVEIKKYNEEIKEGDDEWDESDNDYEWNPDSTLSFRPKQSGFYIVGVTVKDPNDYNKETTAYQVIQIHNPIDVTPGQSNWLKNNVTSVVLFGISGLLAVVIVILFLVKPSEKKIEEIDLEKLKGKKK